MDDIRTRPLARGPCVDTVKEVPPLARRACSPGAPPPHRAPSPLGLLWSGGLAGPLPYGVMFEYHTRWRFCKMRGRILFFWSEKSRSLRA